MKHKINKSRERIGSRVATGDRAAQAVLADSSGSRMLRLAESSLKFDPLDERDPDYLAKRDARLRACFEELAAYLVPNPRPLTEDEMRILATPLEAKLTL